MIVIPQSLTTSISPKIWRILEQVVSNKEVKKKRKRELINS